MQSPPPVANLSEQFKTPSPNPAVFRRQNASPTPGGPDLDELNLVKSPEQVIEEDFSMKEVECAAGHTAIGAILGLTTALRLN